MTRSALNDLFLGERTVAQLVASGELQVEGRLLTIAEFLSLLDSFEFEFNIVTP
jgi:alkyl sulfatase BDS1-like metallo-beta-lactamase superfamily hydrolase